MNYAETEDSQTKVTKKLSHAIASKHGKNYDDCFPRDFTFLTFLGRVEKFLFEMGFLSAAKERDREDKRKFFPLFTSKGLFSELKRREETKSIIS